MDSVFVPGSEKQGIKNKKTLQICVFSKNLFKKTMTPIFLQIFFDENVAEDPAQILTRTKVFRIFFQF